MKKSVITSDRVLLIMIIVLILGVSLWGGDRVQVGYAVADCVDSDEDGYYDEGCSLEDLGCEDEEEIIVDSYNKNSLDIDESYFVYVSDSVVYGYDLVSLSSSLLSNVAESSLNPRVDYPYVVWQALVGSYWQIYVYDANTLSASLVSASTSHQISPDVYSSYIVWADNLGGDWDVYLYDLNSGTGSMIISGEGNQYSPRIYGDYVAYVDDASGTKDVYVYSLSTGTSSLVDGSDGDQNGIGIYENYVVWQSDAAGSWDVYGYDLSSGGVYGIATESYDEKLPRVSENLIVWMEYDENDYDLRYYDFATGENYLLTDDGYNQVVPVVSGSYVLWQDDRNGYYDIYGQAANSVCDDLSLGDCDDDSLLVSPAGVEECDYIDNDCDGEIDEDCAAVEGGCLISDISSNVWADSEWAGVINSAVDGESVYMVSYGDGSCGTEASEFYLYSAVYDSGEYVTDELVESYTTGTMKNYDGYDVSYVSWDAVYDSDKYYYFISVLNGTAVLGDTLLVCESADCVGESVTISDAEDYLSLYSAESGCLTDDDCDSGESCVDGACEESSEECIEDWDCSNVEWSECEDGVSTLDLSLCLVIPVSDACYSEDYLPVTEKSCSSDSVGEVDSSIESEEVSVEEDIVTEEITEEVPVFTWINLLLVVGILTCYYAFRSKVSYFCL